jgi:hypothetical protein
MKDRRWELFLDALKALACEPDVQLARFPDFVAKVDELALEFDHWYGVAQGLSKLTTDQIARLDAIDGRLKSMSGPQSARFWTEDALAHDPAWAELRKMAADALRVLGHEPDPPGPAPGTYIGAN